MAKNLWALPDGFDNTVKKALVSLVTALKNAKRSIPPEAFDALRIGNWQAFQELMDWHGIEGDFETFKQILQAQAKKAALEFYQAGGVGAKLTFDLIDERAVTWASKRAGELVVEITDQMRMNIRNTVTSSTLGDMTWQQASEEIKAVIPLTSRDAEAVSKFYNRSLDRFLKKAIPLDKAKEKANLLRNNYADKLLQSRANTIARTEIASAASQGRLLGWEAGVESGLVDTASVKEWIAEPSACEICADMDGKTIPWDDEFPAGVMMPPAHPNCRCSAAILPPDYADSVFTNQAMIKSKVNQFEVEFAKHLEGQHDQTSHGHRGVAYTLPSKREAPDVAIYSEVSSVKPYVGLSPKAQAIAAQIGASYGHQNEVEHTWGASDWDNKADVRYADWTAKDGQTYKMALYKKVNQFENDSNQIETYRSKSPDIDVEILDSNNEWLASMSVMASWTGELTGQRETADANFYYVITGIGSEVKGAGTAMLEFARREADYPIFHNSDLTSQGRKFARTTKSLAKHLLGQHDQSTHAGGHARTVEAKPHERKFTKADWNSVTEANATNLSVDEQVAMMSYQTNGYRGVNEYLRNPTLAGAVFHQADAEILTKAVNRFTIDEDIIVRRGVGPDAFGLYLSSEPDDFLALKGKAFTEKGFLSTAAYKAGTQLIRNPQFDNMQFQMKIHVPKGTKGVAINPKEGEILLAPNTTLLITDVRQVDSFASRYEIDAEVVGQ